MTNDLHDGDGLDQWDRVASELRACRESQRRAYGGIDSAALGRYLAGEASDGEQAQMESALGDLPDLRLLADLVKDVLGGLEPVNLDPAPLPVAVAEPEPALLPFRRPAPRRAGFFQKRASLAAAACLLLALGLGLPAVGLFAPPARSGDGLALGFSPEGGEASRGFGGLDKMADSQPPVRVAMAAPQPPPHDRVADRRRAFRKVSSLNHAGEQARQHGRYMEAADCYREAQRVCKSNRIGDKHPATATAIRGEAKLIGLALNASPASQASAQALGDRLDEKPIRDLREHVVPVLAEAFRSSPQVKERLLYASALGKVGPAAAPAARTLVLRLMRSHDASEKSGVLDALLRMGPPARQEMLAMLGEARPPQFVVRGEMRLSAKAGFSRSLNGADKARLRDALDSLAGDHGAVGVQDTLGRCTVRVARETTDKLRGLARTRHVEALVETVGSGPRPDPARRLAGLGKRAVYVVLCPAKKSASLHVSESLRRDKFPAAEIAKALGASLAAHGCDRAVAEVPQRLAAALAR